jgi:TP901 family phage tail tape measure protein
MARKTIGSLMIGVGVDLTEFEKKMNRFQKEFGKLGQQVQDAGQQIGMAFGAVSLAIGAGLGYAVKKAADFEQGLSNIKAVSGATGKEMEQLKKLAMDMGASTKYSATEAAMGIEELIKAGVSVENILGGGLKGALSLASAGNIELAQAAEIASTALNAFRNDNLSVAKAADILAGAANASATSVEEMQFGLQQASAVASMVGLSFEDTSSALAVFAQNGLKGSDAGTSLKTMLMTLQPQTKEQIALATELGIVTADGSNAFYDAAGNIKPLSQIAGVLQKALEGMTAAQQQSTLKTLFGTDAVRAASILYKEGADGVNKMKAAMSNVTAEEVAAEKSNNFNGQLEKLKGSMETLAISLGESLLPALTDLAKNLEDIVNWFNSLSPTTKKFITYGAVLTFVITGLTAVVGFLAMGMGALAVAEWAVLAPILLIVAAVIAVIAIFALLWMWLKNLYETNKTFAAVVDTVWNYIKTAIKIVVDAVLPVIKSLWEQFKNGLSEMWAIVKPIFDMIGDAIMEVVNYFKKSGSSAGTMKKIITNAFKIIGNIISITMTVTMTIIKTVLHVIVTIFKVAFTIVKTVISVVFSVIKTIIKTAMDIIKGIINVIIKVIKGDWEGAWNAIKETVSKVFGNIKEFITGLKTKFMEAGKGLINAVIDGVKNAGKGLVDAFKGLMKKVRDFLPFSPAKEGPLSDLDKLDFAGPISDSIKSGAPNVQAQLNSMLSVPDINSTVTANNTGGTTVIMQLDSKTIASKTFEHMGGVFRVRGAVT